jgi:subtilisin family serine protease
VERQPLAALGAEVAKLRIPSGIGLEAAREQVRAAAPGAAVDFNHYYRPGADEMSCEGRHCMAPTLVGWPASGTMPASCSGSGLRIGLIDTAINPDHAVFSRGQVEVVRVSKDTLPESGRQHGTAVAALLVGDAASRTPGLLPAASLVAVDAFHRGSGQDDRADAYDLARAIDTLAAKDVDVVNMSLSGPANAALERVVSRAAAGELVLVGAAGNAGPRAAPLYPAAYADVIAVTAVDRSKRAYRRAAQGDHIDLAAPGVDVWTAASISGGRSKTGTSFAAPFVTAAAALAGSDGQSTVAEIHAALAETAEDLGAPGKDPIFGWGLLNARSLCERDASEGRPATAQ